MDWVDCVLGRGADVRVFARTEQKPLIWPVRVSASWRMNKRAPRASPRWLIPSWVECPDGLIVPDTVCGTRGPLALLCPRPPCSAFFRAMRSRSYDLALVDHVAIVLATNGQGGGSRRGEA